MTDTTSPQQFTYLHMQEGGIIDGMSEDFTVRSRLPWPVTCSLDGTVTVPSSALMRRVVGFQRDLAVQQVDVWLKDAFADPSQVIGMYIVTEDLNGGYQHGMTAVSSAEIWTLSHEIPVER